MPADPGADPVVPKILIGTAGEIAAQVLERGARLGLTYQVLRGAALEVLAEVIGRVRGTSGENEAEEEKL